MSECPPTMQRSNLDDRIMTKRTMKRTLPLSLTLLLCSGASATAAEISADYDSKMKAALEIYAARTDGILQRAIREGYDGAVDTVQIHPNGGDSLYTEFGLDAVNQELERIEKMNEQNDLYHEYEEAFEELTAQNGTSSATITYSQLEEWEDIAIIIDKLEEGEFLTLWQKATGSESSEGGMTLSQFILFNDLLDKLVMAKVDFKALTKRMPTKEIPYEILYKWPALSEELSDIEFHELWKIALGEDILKGKMNYHQFLTFYELAEEWLERDIGVVVEEEKERRENYWVKSGNTKRNTDVREDEEEEEEDDGYDEIPTDDKRSRFYIEDEYLPDDIREGLESDDEDVRKEAMLRRTLDPERWFAFSYWDIYAFFGCEKAFDSPRPLWTDQQWRDVRDFYHEFVEEDKKDGPIAKVRTYQFSEDHLDLSLNAIPVQSRDKGRGLQAVRDIKAGESVFRATNNTIVFNYGHTWRKLLFAINKRFDDPGIACDMHVWSWVQDLYDGGPMKIFMDLDSGSLLNEGRDDPGWDPPNVQCGKPDATRCDMDYYAFRDIKEGDELLIDYREFAHLGAWPAMGL